MLESLGLKHLAAVESDVSYPVFLLLNTQNSKPNTTKKIRKPLSVAPKQHCLRSKVKLPDLGETILSADTLFSSSSSSSEVSCIPLLKPLRWILRGQESMPIFVTIP